MIPLCLIASAVTSEPDYQALKSKVRAVGRFGKITVSPCLHSTPCVVTKTQAERLDGRLVVELGWEEGT